MSATKKEFVDARDIWYPSVITEIDTPEGVSILQDSYHVPFLLLEGQFEAQENGAFCGIASSVISLNTLHRAQKYTQQELYTFVCDNFLKSKKEMNYGLSLQQVKQMLEFIGGVEVEIHATTDKNELSEQFRKDIEKCIVQESTREDISPRCFIICNFWRQLKDHHGGHISPIAAYSKETDKILVLDTNPKRFQPHWISTDFMISSMCTVDKTSNQPRGYLVVSIKE